jgi:hypothetical protein
MSRYLGYVTCLVSEQWKRFRHYKILLLRVRIALRH